MGTSISTNSLAFFNTKSILTRWAFSDRNPDFFFARRNSVSAWERRVSHSPGVPRPSSQQRENDDIFDFLSFPPRELGQKVFDRITPTSPATNYYRTG